MAGQKVAVPAERLERLIMVVRGRKIMLSTHLADLYEVEPRVLVQAVKRNIDRFPPDFMFQLSEAEFANLKSQFVISNHAYSVCSERYNWLYVVGVRRVPSPVANTTPGGIRSQPDKHVSNWGGQRRATPYAFTEQGVAMLSSVLNSKRAVQVNIEIMRTFARFRQLLASHTQLARKLDALERKYDAQFKIVFDAIRELMTQPQPKKRRIGFLVSERPARYGNAYENAVTK